MLPLKPWGGALLAVLLWSSRVLTATAPGWDYSLDMAADNFAMENPDVGYDGSVDLLMYSTILEYDSDTKDWSEDDLFGLAFQAFQEMRVVHGDIRRNCGNTNKFPDVPTGVSAIALGNKVYIASSLRGSKARQWVYVKTSAAYLQNRLNECRAAMVQTAEDNGDNISDGGYALRPCWSRSTGPQELGCSNFVAFEGLNEMRGTSDKYNKFKRASSSAPGDKNSWPVPSNTNKRPIKTYSGSIKVEVEDPMQVDVPGS
ncbi:hypothetical protein FH972_020980 [Carpinus fangiana]|uniref:Uncharacterized protein n=1 Tax=Carpinus fangiana TaxID=176857 RepID=A0A5N6KNK6_9ROSI|nr:hypothetical protein FH972_020980 [Carpinus fangiana]